MNVLIDSYGWIEYFCEGKLANKYAKYVEKAGKKNYFTPTIIIYEVYKQIKKNVNEEKALEAIANIMNCTTIVDLDYSIALEAGDANIEQGLGMADAIIKKTAKKYDAMIITSDEHFKKMEKVIFI